MLVVGLTGGISTGKSTVSSLLKGHNIPVVDADHLARKVVQPGTRALAQIVAYFGDSILLPDGTLDRQKLGAVIFRNEEKRKKLNSIIHPAVRREMFWEVLVSWLTGKKICVLDVPLLIETGLHKMVGETVVVYCSEKIQLERLIARDKITEEEALPRIRAQMPISDKVHYADRVLDNSGTLEDLKVQVDSLLVRLRSKVKWTWLPCWIFPPFGFLLGAWALFSRGYLRRTKNQKKA